MNLNTLPTSGHFGLFIHEASEKFNITMLEARHTFGMYTYGEWYKMMPELKALTEKKRYYYYLFGGNASQEYGFADSFETFLIWAKKSDSTDFAIHRHDTLRETPTDLLKSIDGWMGYQEISESEYLQLQEIINNLNQ